MPVFAPTQPKLPSSANGFALGNRERRTAKLPVYLGEVTVNVSTNNAADRRSFRRKTNSDMANKDQAVGSLDSAIHASLVSIVIAAYNSEQYIHSTLASIRNQSFSEWECIIVDDGSNDSTCEIAEGFARDNPRFIVLRRPAYVCKGSSCCRNYGMLHARGEFIQFFDSDDLMKVAHLEKKVAALHSSDADVVVSQLQEVFVDGKVRINSIALEGGVADLIGGKSNWYVCGPLWRASVISGVKFPEGISNLDDLIFNLRCLQRVKSIEFIHEPLVKYLRHTGGITGAYSSATPRETESTINARQIILGEAKASGFYDGRISRALINSYTHVAYLVATRRQLRSYIKLLGLLCRTTKSSSALQSLRLLAYTVLWLTTGKGYFLVRERSQ